MRNMRRSNPCEHVLSVSNVGGLSWCTYRLINYANRPDLYAFGLNQGELLSRRARDGGFLLLIFPQRALPSDALYIARSRSCECPS